MCLSKKNKPNLRIFERKMLRKILLTKRISESEEEYRTLWNHEIDQKVERKNIINLIEAQRLKWFRHRKTQLLGKSMVNRRK